MNYPAASSGVSGIELPISLTPKATGNSTLVGLIMRYFCTYFDHHYLSRGVALYRFLKRYCPSFKLWVLCLDSSCYAVLSQMNLSEMNLISLAEFEAGDEKLVKTKENRSLIEYYFTCTPSWTLFVLNNFSEIDIITYLDTDLFFYGDLKPIYDEMAGNSIAIIEHRFPRNLRSMELYGTYNVGWLSFRRNKDSLDCLNWWRERCIEWCYDRSEEGRFGDQKYLDDWPSRFRGVIVLRHKGANLAPWNLANYEISGDRYGVRVDGEPLIFFHFHGLKHIDGWVYDPGLEKYQVKPSSVVRRYIYGPYIQELSNITKRMSTQSSNAPALGSIRKGPMKSQQPPYASRSRVIIRRYKKLPHLFKGIFNKKYLLIVNGHAV